MSRFWFWPWLGRRTVAIAFDAEFDTAVARWPTFITFHSSQSRRRSSAGRMKLQYENLVFWKNENILFFPYLQVPHPVLTFGALLRTRGYCAAPPIVTEFQSIRLSARAQCRIDGACSQHRQIMRRLNTGVWDKSALHSGFLYRKVTKCGRIIFIGNPQLSPLKPRLLLHVHVRQWQPVSRSRSHERRSGQSEDLHLFEGFGLPDRRFPVRFLNIPPTPSALNHRN